MRRQKTEQEKLLHRLQVADFALHESALYLDGHPYDRAAMEYYGKMREKHDALTREYEEMFGPVTYFGNLSQDWQWSEGPWPWQTEEMANMCPDRNGKEKQ